MSIITKILDKKPHFDFIKYHKIGFMVSLILLAVGAFSLHSTGLKFGIDFTGGILIEVKSDTKIDIEKMRKDIKGTGVQVLIQSLGQNGDEAMIRAKGEGSEELQMANVAKIQQAIGSNYEIRRTEMVGPQVGEELKNKSLLAALLAVAAIAVYVWFRFEWQFAICAFASLAHDTLITLGFFSIIGREFDLTIVAALLTLIGYSINDTVVSYDRVRSNVRKHKRMPIPEILNLSLNETLGRTMLTSMSTLVALLAIFFLGGEVLRGFSITLIWGVLIGTFSSIYLAVPLLNYFNIKVINEGE
jgi:preprotein translocase SecF subunit